MLQRSLTWLFLIMLILIHTVDMELTNYYIGNNWQGESFPPMQFAIKIFGIHAALWISRGIMYTYFFFALINRDKQYWFYFLILATILYYAGMIGWLFSLGIAEWPFPTYLHSY